MSASNVPPVTAARRPGLGWRAWSWLRDHGLAPFGFAVDGFRHNTLILFVWGPFVPAHFEVYRWPVGTGWSDVESALRPLPPGSSERYHRIGFMAERIYSGHDFRAAKAAR